MRKFSAAIGALIASAAITGAAVMPATSNAHAETGPLCWGNVGYTFLLPSPMGMAAGPLLVYGEPFRIKRTTVYEGQFFSFGHSASTYQVDYWVYTNHLRCDHPPF